MLLSDKERDTQSRGTDLGYAAIRSRRKLAPTPPMRLQPPHSPHRYRLRQTRWYNFPASYAVSCTLLHRTNPIVPVHRRCPVLT
eukprot:687221-Rhodomonas_salina.1